MQLYVATALFDDRARPAQPEHVDDVPRFGESVLGRDRLGPRFDRGGFDFDGEPTSSTNEVVVVTARARAVHDLTFGRVERIGFADARQIGKRTIDGRLSNRRAGFAKGRMEPLSAHETLVRPERFADRIALPRVSFRHFTPFPEVAGDTDGADARPIEPRLAALAAITRHTT